MRSDSLKKRAPIRALLHATGVSNEEMGKPFIGLGSSFTDLVPGHVDMRSLERAIEKGVHAGGGVSFTFGLPAICDGIAMGHKGMYYSLPSRELIADEIETMAEAHQLDGLILLTACDKITPGMLMAAARLNIPTILVTAGPMLAGSAWDTLGSYRWAFLLGAAGCLLAMSLAIALRPPRAAEAGDRRR